MAGGHEYRRAQRDYFFAVRTGVLCGFNVGERISEPMYG